MLKCYVSKSKRNNVCNIVRLSDKHKFICTPVSMGFVADKVALGQLFHNQYHSIKDPYSFIQLYIILTDSVFNTMQTRNVQLCGGGEDIYVICEISGFRHDVHEICDHLGLYAASSSNSISTFRANLSDPTSRVGVE